MEMIEVKTDELVGPALDWVVASCCMPMAYGPILVDGKVLFELEPGNTDEFMPSSGWSQGGPLIEKYLIAFCVEHEDVILAALCDDYGMYVGGWRQGETHLIAACRAIVAAKLGDTVRAPAALVGCGA